VVVTDLTIYFDTLEPSNSRLRAATYGRGAWETGLPPTAPVCYFSASSTAPVIYDTIDLTDQSGASPTYWFWSISPSTFEFTEEEGQKIYLEGMGDLQLKSPDGGKANAKMRVRYEIVENQLQQLLVVD